MSSSGESLWPWKESAKKVNRGAFIVVEGLDRAGKTTQVKHICDALYSEGHNVKSIRFPDRTTPMGRMINSYLQSNTEMDDHTIHLLFSANRWEQAKWIEETLNSGYTIICDRYYHSGMVYSVAKKNPALSITWARAPEVGLPRPDLVIFLDLEPEEAARRGGYGEEKYEKKEMQINVRKIFLGLSEIDGYEGDDLKVFDAGKSIEEVRHEIWQTVLPKVKQVESSDDATIRLIQAWSEDTLDGHDNLKNFHFPGMIE